jgi:hypothetical protein
LMEPWAVRDIQQQTITDLGAVQDKDKPLALSLHGQEPMVKSQASANTMARRDLMPSLHSAMRICKFITAR